MVKKPLNLSNYREEKYQIVARVITYIKEQLENVNTHKKAVTDASEKLALANAQAKVNIGKELVKEFFNNDWRELEKSDYSPVKEKAWALLLQDKEFPFKSKSAHHNILRCGAQARWAEEEQISLDGISFTSQVHLTKLPNDEEKKQVIEIITSGQHEYKTERKEWTSRAVDTLVRGLTVATPKLPEDIEKVFTFVKLDADIVADIKKYQEYTPRRSNPDTEHKVEDTKLGTIKTKIDEKIQLLQNAISDLRKTKQTLEKKEPIDDADFTEYEEKADK
jgi:hypothetical protein